ncbi:amidohydrolase [Psychrosphaera haliotis]|uniref:Amidohydrolase family protein n=1 Tax=Psychrosphaera haliotis TaxID=555083 RepID=A0A6N8F7W3_9GAMM|nr:amidohydrolase [Psychrosphaera haliotis]MUH72264.1 amidohydrolase family protein [Psychrosphaera haliotis]
MKTKTMSMLIILLLCSGCSTVDTLYVNGTIWTGVKGAEQATVLAIKGNKIAFVGTDVPIGLSSESVIDLQGRFVMHGFIDNHVHFFEGGAALASVDLRQVSSREEFIQKIIQFSQELQPERWVLNGNWDHEQWGGFLPHKSWIDQGTSKNPVYVIRTDGHMALANSLALKLANITRDTPDPEGGKIMRDKTGKPTGILKGNALNLILEVIPEPSEEELLEQFTLAQNHALALGLSKVHAVTAYPTETKMLQYFKLARDRKVMKIRSFVSTPIESLSDAASTVSNEGRGDHLLSFGGVKGFIDGSLGARTAWFHKPYYDESTNYGLPLNNPEVFNEWLKSADEAELSLSIHALGDRGIDTVIKQLENIAGDSISEKRYRIEHFQHPTAQAIQKVAEHGIIVSMQPYHAIDDGRWAEQRIGPIRLQTTYAFKSILDAGGLLTFGSDWPVAPLSPIEGIYAAVTRRTLDDKHPNGWVPKQKITVEEALTAYTVTNSYAFNNETTSGTLEKENMPISSFCPLILDKSHLEKFETLEF